MQSNALEPLEADAHRGGQMVVPTWVDEVLIGRLQLSSIAWPPSMGRESFCPCTHTLFVLEARMSSFS